MRQMASLRTFNQAEILDLLYACSQLLDEAYQDTLVSDFKDVSFEATMACEYLRCELAQSNQSFRLH